MSQLSSSKEGTEINRILVAVDGSENATKAVKVASAMAKRNNAKLIIIHVITVSGIMYSGGLPLPPDRIEADARREADKLVESAALIAERAGIKPKTAIIERMNSPVRGVTDYAKKNMIDLIVVGTRGLGGFKRLVLGSVARGVVHYANCSVLVVR